MTHRHREGTNEPPRSFALSFAQQRLWFLDQLDRGSGAYNILEAFRIRGALDLEALERSLEAIVARHETLRTTFPSVDGEPVQVVGETGWDGLTVVDLSGGEDGELEAHRLAAEEARQSFDLARGPLFRSRLLKLGEQQHVLLLTMHHIVSDAWSMRVLRREITALYASFLEGRPSPVTRLPIQYGDFALAQRGRLQGETIERQLGYWRRQLAGAAALELPTDRPRPSVQTSRGTRQGITLDRKLSEAVKTLSQREGVTRFMTLLGTFQTLLARYAGQHDIVVGAPVAGRTRPEVEGLIGFFVNTLVLRTDFSAEPSFRDVLRRVRDVAVGGLAHQDVPFEKLVDELRPERSLDRNPLFQVMLAFQNAPAEPLELSGAAVTPFDVDRARAKFDLTLALEDGPDGLGGFLEYNTDLFDAATAGRMIEHFENLLRACVARPDQRVWDLPLMGAAERRRTVIEWNETAAAYASESCVHHLFERQVDRCPDAVAVTFGDERLSYRELEQRANQLARHLQSLGVGPDVLVGLCAERSLEMVVGLLGVFKAGGAYVPLDPSYPKERLAFMLKDAGVTVLLTQARLAESLPEHGARVVLLDGDWPRITQESTARCESGAVPGSLAYVIYTSGSTGKPKGVLVEHRGLCNVAEAQARAFGVVPSGRVLQFSSLSFDASAFDILMALPVGATLCLGTRESLMPGEPLLEFLRDQSISIMTVPPSVLALLPDAGLPALETITVAGEACPAELVRRWSPGRRFFNLYGPTETSIWATFAACTDGAANPPIGRPIPNARVYLLSPHFQPVPVGVAGEVYIAGAGVTRGYLGRPELTAERFLPDPFGAEAGGRLYRTGDLARHLPDGQIEYLERVDQQVKVRGFRIELGEIEASLRQHAAVRDAVVVVREDQPKDMRLVAYVSRRPESSPSADELRSHLKAMLPEHMVPSVVMVMDSLPLSPNGKVDRKALPALVRPSGSAEAFVPPRNHIEEAIAAVWREVLRLEKVGIQDNFFDLGGHSLLLVQVHSRLRTVLKQELSIVDLFRFPTVGALARHVGETRPSAWTSEEMRPTTRRADGSNRIAVIAMSGRFPGARSVEELWRNLREGVESIRSFSDEEARADGVDPTLLARADYVKAGAPLDEIELFDASFFQYHAREAEGIDPQQRLFLECAWEALEAAGCDPARYKGRIGVYGGVGTNDYSSGVAATGFDRIGTVGDFLSTRVSYKLNLKGPSLSVQTACSTSLVAVHLACQSLLSGECEMALAGGVSIRLPQKVGYLYEEGGIRSPDGHCRAFDAQARGAVAGNGVGIVILKRLEDALADGDRIEGVIRGTAINNDGAAKVGYTAPSVDGQAEVIAAAQAVAGIKPSEIGYVEAHGTATPLGDPIEIAALTQVFRAETDAKGFCAIGSLKTNMGHLDAAAGVAGLIKAVLAVKHGMIPPSLHFETSNPQIDFGSSPFYVNTALSKWKSRAPRRIAGVSSFGIGGTNAHVVVEEPPVVEDSGPSRPAQLLIMSAKTESALEAATAKLAGHLREHPELKLADVAYTLGVGRGQFERRRMVVCRNLAEASGALERAETPSVAEEGRRASVAFLFPGQGSQYVGMGAELYREEAVFRQEVDRCCDLLAPELGIDLRGVIYPEAGESEAASERLKETGLSQPALFVVEYALARLWMSWGVRPEAMIGHSIGEYVAACLSGVFTVEEALGLVAARGKLMQGLPTGAMVTVGLAEEALRRLLDGNLSLAASNGPSLCVVSGATAAVEVLERELGGRGVECRRLHTSHAFHSAMVEPILSAFEDRVGNVELKAPRIPYVSNVTGTWIRAEEATDPRYWTRHLRQTVRFGEGLGELLKESRRALLEVGPGQTLSALARQHPARVSEQVVIASTRHPRERVSDGQQILKALGQLWLAGVEVDWARFYGRERRRRVSLPTYPFERQRYWVHAPATKTTTAVSELRKKPDIADWFYIPSWTRSIPPADTDRDSRWLLFVDGGELGLEVARHLEERGCSAVSVRMGQRFAEVGKGTYTIDPRRREDYFALLGELRARGGAPQRVAHLWGVARSQRRGLEAVDEAQDLGFYSLLFLAQAIGKELPGAPLEIAVVTSDVQDVTGDEALCPEKATVLGPCKVIPQEYPAIRCRSIDVDAPVAESWTESQVAQLVTELEGRSSDLMVAYRKDRRWVQTFRPLKVEARAERPRRLREGGVYLIAGGLGGVGLELAASLAQAARAKLVLTSRSGLPPPEEWPEWLGSHDADDTTSRRIRRMQALEALGAEVLVMRADVTSEREMKAVLDRTVERFGALHGVLHAAGAEKQGRAIAEADREHCERQFRPKLQGLTVLAKVLEGQPLDFLMVQSSLASVLGVVGFVSYAAAHVFMDAFACRQNRVSQGTPWLCVNWDNWGTGRLTTPARPGRVEFMTGPEEGTEAFQRVLGLQGATQVLVSTGDLQARLDQWSTPSFPSRPPLPAEAVSAYARPDLSTAYVAPRSERERILAAIWKDLLRLERVGVHDNFFELGGDSVLSIQVATRSVEAGLRLSSHELLQRQTIAELASIAEPSARPTAMKAAGLGPVPLTPIQHWLFEQELTDPHHFNQARLLQVPPAVDLSLLDRAWQAVFEHHDALRLLYRKVDGLWHGTHGDFDGTIAITRVDLAALPEKEQGRAVETRAAELQPNLDLSKGPLVRAAYLDLGPNRHGRLLLIIHHLVVDAVSWRILLEDLHTAYRQLSAGQAVHLPPPTTSFAQWAVSLAQYANSTELANESRYWLSMPWGRVQALPKDRRGGVNTVASARQVSTALGADHTRSLLHEVPERYKTQINDVLLAALAVAFQGWTGTPSLLVDLEGHGREQIGDGLDVSRTVGWFTTLFPVLLDLEAASGPLAILKTVKEQLRAVPGRGIGYGLLRYVREDEDTAKKLRELPQAEVSFLYLGRLDLMAPATGPFRTAEESSGDWRSTRDRRRHLLEISAHVSEGQLHTTWTYGENIHHRSTVEELAQSFLGTLRVLVGHAETLAAKAHISSDFPAARLDQRELEEFLSSVKRTGSANAR